MYIRTAITLGAFGYMHQERVHGTGQTITVSRATTTTVDTVAITPDQLRYPDSATQALGDILHLLEALGIKIAHFTSLHTNLISSLPTENSHDDEALAWMQTALEDISATLIGVAAYPRQQA